MQVFQVQKRHPLFVGHAKGDVQDALLCLGKAEQLGDQQRAHLGNGGANGVALLPKEIPKGHRKGLIGIVVKADLCRAFGEGAVQFGGLASRDCKAGQIAFHIRQKHRHPGIGKTLGKDLQRHRLARARRPRDQPVAVGIAEIEKLLGRMVGTAAADKDVTAHAGAFLSNLAIRPFH